MSERDYSNSYDEEYIRMRRAELIRLRNHPDGIFKSRAGIEVLDKMIKELDEKYPNARFEIKREQEYKDNFPKKPKTKANKNLSSFFSAIPFSILGLICFYILGMIATLLGVLIKVVLSYIPLLKFFAQFDIEYFAVVISIIIVKALCDKVIKNGSTKKFTIIFFGTLLILCDLVFLIFNVLSGTSSILANIIRMILGAIALNMGIKYNADTENK